MNKWIISFISFVFFLVFFVMWRYLSAIVAQYLPNEISSGMAGILLSFVFLFINNRCIKENKIFILGEIKGFWILYGVIFILNVLELVFNAPTEQFVTVLFIFKDGYQIALTFFAVAVLAPIYEEIIFRGFLHNSFVRVFGTRFWSVLIFVVLNALVFSMLHSQYYYFWTYVSLFIYGVIFSIARYVSKGLLLPIMLHSMTTITVLVFEFLLKPAIST